MSNAKKVEPVAHAINVKGVAQIGMALGNKATDTQGTLPNPAKSMYAGRGFEAPMNKTTQHHSGSQRRHD